MPIDPNIALGVRPPEPINMLGQMGQMMALRQANEEYQSNNALKDFYAQGGDLSKAEDQRRFMSTVGAKGADLIAKQAALEKTKAEVKKLGYDNVESEFKQSRQLLTSIDPDSPNAGSQLLAWHEANHKSPIMGSVLAASGISAESSRASIEAAIAKGPAGIREAIRRSSLGQADYQKELMQTERSHIAAGPGNRQASVAEQKLAMEKAQQDEISRILRGEPLTAPAAAPTTFGGGGGVAPITGGGVAPVAAPTAGVAPIAGGTPMPVATAVQPNVNALNAPPAAPVAGNVNALTAGAVPPEIAKMQTQISQLISTGSPKAIAAADALIKQHNMLMPSRQIVQNEKGAYNAIDQRTGASTPVLDSEGKQLVGKLPPEQFESSYKKVVGEAKGTRDVGMVTAATAATDNLPKLYETLDQLKTSDAITGFGADIIKNIEAAKAKFTGDIKAGKRVADTQILDAMLGSDVFPMIQ